MKLVRAHILRAARQGVKYLHGTILDHAHVVTKLYAHDNRTSSISGRWVIHTPGPRTHAHAHVSGRRDSPCKDKRSVRRDVLQSDHRLNRTRHMLEVELQQCHAFVKRVLAKTEIELRT